MRRRIVAEDNRRRSVDPSEYCHPGISRHCTTTRTRQLGTPRAIVRCMKLARICAIALLISCGPSGGEGDDDGMGMPGDADGDTISDTDEGSGDTDGDGTADLNDTD